MIYYELKASVVEALGDRPAYSLAAVARYLGKARESIPRCGVRLIRDGKRQKVTQAALIEYLEGRAS